MAAYLDVTPQYFSQLMNGREPGVQLEMLVTLMIEKRETQFNPILFPMEQSIRALVRDELSALNLLPAGDVVVGDLTEDFVNEPKHESVPPPVQGHPPVAGGRGRSKPRSDVENEGKK